MSLKKHWTKLIPGEYETIEAELEATGKEQVSSTDMELFNILNRALKSFSDFRTSCLDGSCHSEEGLSVIA